jgi:hypothetical protein
MTMESPSRAEPLTPSVSLDYARDRSLRASPTLSPSTSFGIFDRREREMNNLSLRERSIRSAAADRIW